MRIATFNVENMFERAKAMNLNTWAEGKTILQDYKRLNELIQRDTYTDAVKQELLDIMKGYRGLLTKGESNYLRLRDIRGKLLSRPKGKPVEIAAGGRSDWIGWFELEKEAVSETATENTARVLGLLKADVQCLVEAENRIGLMHFNDDVLPKVKATPFNHVMLIDGNDDRGIDVAIMTRTGFEIVGMTSHVDDTDAEGRIFSRDCPEYEIQTPSGNRLLVLVNHFKSKGYGGTKESEEKRLRQATRVREIYDQRLAEGYEYIAVAGDLNEVPGNYPLDPLLRNGSSLVDSMAHGKFSGDGRPGTHGNGTASARLDYVLMSPALSAKVTACGIERCGVWGGKNGTLFPHLDTIKKSMDAASDHAALWVEADV